MPSNQFLHLNWKMLFCLEGFLIHQFYLKQKHNYLLFTEIKLDNMCIYILKLELSILKNNNFFIFISQLCSNKEEKLYFERISIHMKILIPDVFRCFGSNLHEIIVFRFKVYKRLNLEHNYLRGEEGWIPGWAPLL